MIINSIVYRFKINYDQYKKFKEYDEYVSGAIVLTKIENKGRGYKSTATIQPYTLIMISKPICIQQHKKDSDYQTEQQTIEELYSQVDKNINSKDFSPSIKRKYKMLYYGGEQYENNLLNKFNFNSYRVYPQLDCYYDQEDDVQNPKIGLFPLASYFNHSCVPNCTSWFESDKMFIITNQLIQLNEELTLSYIIHENSYSFSYIVRQRYLQQYGFQCNCRLCQYQKNNYKKYQTYEEYINDIKNNQLTAYGYESELIQEYLKQNINDEQFQKNVFDNLIELRKAEPTLIYDAYVYMQTFTKLSKEYIAQKVDQVYFGRNDHINIRYNLSINE